MISVNERRRKDRASYLVELKENIGFLVGLSGAMVALLIFHYSVYKIRETEYFKVNVDMLNENMFIDGIRASLQMIIWIISLIGLFIVLTYIPRRKLSGKVIELEDGIINKWFMGVMTSLIACVFILVIYGLAKGYNGDVPNSRLAFIILTVATILQLGTVAFNYYQTSDRQPTKTIIDFPVLLQFLYVTFMILFYLFPYYHIDQQITNTESITVTTNKQFMLVEKTQSDVLLREIIPKTNDKQNQFTLTDNYITMDAKKVMLMEQPINETINFEQENYIEFENEGKN